ncbi:MAG: transcriptional repressor [Planctomycetes bacterium]|nr:transcriptional repressor [Planctomycetota bacterium]
MLPLDDRLVDLEARCRARQVAITLPRRAVFEALLRREDHPTADDIHADVSQQVDGVSRATVYRTLELLVKAELLVRVCHPDASTRYDIKIQRHHHLICDGCGSIHDLEHPPLNRLKIPEQSDAGFRVRDYSVHIRGLCPPCARKS